MSFIATFARTSVVSLALMAACAPPPPPGGVVIVRRPPPLQREVVLSAPGPGFVWIDGYYRGGRGDYEWVPGRWERVPPGYHRWEAARWRHYRGGYVYIEGRWR